MSGDIKKVADELEPGEAGVILVADATFEAGAEKLMKRAKKHGQAGSRRAGQGRQEGHRRDVVLAPAEPH